MPSAIRSGSRLGGLWRSLRVELLDLCREPDPTYGKGSFDPQWPLRRSWSGPVDSSQIGLAALSFRSVLSFRSEPTRVGAEARQVIIAEASRPSKVRVKPFGFATYPCVSRAQCSRHP